jgi:hypothetical protein
MNTDDRHYHTHQLRLHYQYQCLALPLVLSNLHIVKLNQSLHTKENIQEKYKNKFMQAGMRRYYTCDKFIAEEEQVEEIQKAKKAAKYKRQENCNTKKQAKNAQNIIWKEARAQYDWGTLHYT